MGSRKLAFLLCLVGCVPEADAPGIIEVPVEVPVAEESYLILEEEGSPMPKKLTELVAASSVSDADQLYLEQSGTSKRVTVGLAAPLPMNYIAGLITAQIDDYDIDIAPGVARDDTDVDNMRLASTTRKQFDAAWAVGTNQGGLDTGVVGASQMYAIWLIKRSDTGVVDVLYSLSFTSPTMPTNYDRKRLIAAIHTDAATHIENYNQTGDFFCYQRGVEDVDDSTIADDVPETGTLSVPPWAIAQILGWLGNPTSTDLRGELGIYVSEGSELLSYVAYSVQATSGTFDEMCHRGAVRADASRQIKYRASEATGSATVKIHTLGFMMTTRRDP